MERFKENTRIAFPNARTQRIKEVQRKKLKNGPTGFGI